jgi:hypothetical protein
VVTGKRVFRDFPLPLRRAMKDNLQLGGSE